MLKRVAISGVKDWVCILTTIADLDRVKHLTIESCFISDGIVFMEVSGQMVKTICTTKKREIRLLITQKQSLGVPSGQD